MSEHGVLETAELLDQIIQLLSPPDLFRASLVSKAISHHALTYLWRTLMSPAPLLELCPAHVRRKELYVSDSLSPLYPTSFN